MANILPRKRKDGSTGYTANIRIKKDGKIIHREAQTFDRKAAAEAWVKKREFELSQPGALEKKDDPLLSQVIDRYNEEKIKQHGKTKAQVLRTIAASPLAQLKCSQIGSPQLVEFARSIKASPQTVGNYMAHLGAVFAIAKAAWGHPLDPQAMVDARLVLNKLGAVSKSRGRTRRPTIAELNLLMDHFETIKFKREYAIPMNRIIPFAIFSTRRLEEITRITFEDLDREHLEILVRDMKNPGEKIGNDVRTTLTPEALKLIDLQPVTAASIWPYNHRSISASFTRACKVLGIKDLHFHDLRHDGISRLFEMGWNIPHVAGVSGHRSWQSLKRYTHLRQSGDKYLSWSWFNKVLSSSQ